MIACALDNRVLNGTDSPCLETNQCTETAGSNAAGKAAGGSASSAGRGSQGGAHTHTAGASSSVAGSSEGGAAGDQDVGPPMNCPDLDKNTVPDCMETIATNPGFDGNIKGWSAETSGVVNYETLDAWGNSSSGSVRVENRGMASGPDTGLVYTGASQCVKAQEGRAYVILAQMYARGPTITAYGSVVGRVFASKDCSGTPLQVETSTIEGTVNSWITLRANVPAVTSAGSLLVELSVGKPTSVTGSAALNFDNVLVR